MTAEKLTDVLPRYKGMPLSVWNTILRLLGIGQGGDFRLERTFAVLSLLTITAIITGSAYLQSKFLTQQILLRDATVTHEFIENIVRSEGTAKYFESAGNPDSQQVLGSFFTHLKNMPDVLGVNVYNDNGDVLLSSNPSLLGAHYDDNDELHEAMTGRLVYEAGVAGESDKNEHEALEDIHIGSHFIETYVPIFSSDKSHIVGVVEIYKVPLALEQSLHEGLKRLWLGAIVGGTLLFGTLFWIVRRAAKLIAEQHRRLTDVESFAMIGETAAAVTHSIRNPLASIRAAAELILTDDQEGAKESARDIITETDRLTRWTRELLLFSNHPYQSDKIQTADLNAMVQRMQDDLQEIAAKHSVKIVYDLQAGLPQVRAFSEPASHVVTSIVANAVEAMPNGGTIVVASRHAQYSDRVQLTIEDTGPGLSKEMLSKALKPFYSTKSGGTGLGLPLAKQIMSRFGGALMITNSDSGLIVTLEFASAGR